MKKNLLIKKEKRTYYIEDKEKKTTYECDMASQQIYDNFVQITPLNNQNIVKDTKDILPSEFFEELKEDSMVYGFIEEVQNYFGDCEYKVVVAIENIGICKYFLEDKGKRNIAYYIVTYNIFKKEKRIASEFIVFDFIGEEERNKVKQKIKKELDWNKKKKVKCEKLGYNWIFSAEAAGFFFHECIGHILEEELYRMSKYKKDKIIFKSNINIYENWMKEAEQDDYGNKVCEKVCLIRNGRVEQSLSGKTVSKSQISGNCYTEDPYIAPMARMSNMYIETENPEDNLIGSVVEGIYIDELSSGEYNPYTDEVGLSVNKLYHITNGKIDYAYEPMSILFNLKELKETQIKLGAEMETFQSLCGKYGAVKKIKYTTPQFEIKWRKDGRFITNRDF